MQFFFYGTLMDADLRRLVVGDVVDARLAIRQGVLIGYRRRVARDDYFPMLVPAAGGRVTGLLVDGLRGHALTRIAQFEGEEYVPRFARAVDRDGGRVRACLFLPSRPILVGRCAWNFRRWQREYKARHMRWSRFWLRECPAGTMVDTVVPWHVRRRLAEIDRAARPAEPARPDDARDAPEEGEAFALSSAAE